MSQQNDFERVELMDVLIGVTILFCLVVCHICNEHGIPLDALAVTTGAIMCVQDSTRAAFSSSMTRMIGVVIGGMFGIGIALIDSVVNMPYVFYVLTSLGVVATLLVCKFFSMIYVQARVAGLTMLLVVMVFEGADRLTYAMNRFIGGLAGALFALVVTMAYTVLAKRFKKKK